MSPTDSEIRTTWHVVNSGSERVKNSVTKLTELHSDELILLFVECFLQFLKRWIVKNKGRRWNARTVVNILVILILSKTNHTGSS